MEKLVGNMFKSVKSFRFWSLMLGIASIVPLAYFVYQNWMFSQLAKAQASNGNYVCGTGVFALLAFCIAVGGIVSATGSLLGIVGYLRTERPRPIRRVFEIFLVGGVMVIAIAAGFILF